MNAIGFILRALGILVALCILLVGIMGIVDAANSKATLTWQSESDWTKWDKSKWLAFCENFNGDFANAQTSGLLCLCAIVSILAELRLHFIISKIEFLGSLIGLGVWYLLNGFMCLGIAGDLGIIVGAFAMIVGCIFIAFAFICGSRIRGGYERIK